MANITHKLKLLVTDKSIRNRILFVLGAFVVIRASAIPIPGVDANQLASSSLTTNSSDFLTFSLVVVSQHSQS